MIRKNLYKYKTRDKYFWRYLEWLVARKRPPYLIVTLLRSKHYFVRLKEAEEFLKGGSFFINTEKEKELRQMVDTNYEDMKLVKLRILAKKRKVVGYEHKTKAQIVKCLKGLDDMGITKKKKKIVKKKKPVKKVVKKSAKKKVTKKSPKKAAKKVVSKSVTGFRKGSYREIAYNALVKSINRSRNKSITKQKALDCIKAKSIKDAAGMLKFLYENNDVIKKGIK